MKNYNNNIYYHVVSSVSEFKVADCTIYLSHVLFQSSVSKYWVREKKKNALPTNSWQGFSVIDQKCLSWSIDCMADMRLNDIRIQQSDCPPSIFYKAWAPFDNIINTWGSITCTKAVMWCAKMSVFSQCYAKFSSAMLLFSLLWTVLCKFVIEITVETQEKNYSHFTWKRKKPLH